jgi:UDP-N-acetylmuramate dehydrogenase
MMAEKQNASLRGELRFDEPMSRHTSLKVGGPAEQFFRPVDLDDLSLFLGELDPKATVFWFGLGSNLLVRDGGLPGVVIAASRLSRDLDKVTDHQVRVGTSVPCTQLSRQCIRWGYGPSEFFAGIPGTVGGALAMNAGAHGSETWERVMSVRTIDRHGEIRDRMPSDYEIGYRSVIGPADEWFIEATLQFDPAVDATMNAQKAMLDRRKSTQPLGLPSCGSVFRNPKGDHAARLIESAGLKGHRIGGAEVSTKHANFIINANNATAADIETLISFVHDTVLDKHRVDLIHEVRIVGEAGK